MSCYRCLQWTPRGLLNLSLKSAEEAHVRLVLDYCGGELVFAAQELGVNPVTMHRAYQTQIDQWRHAHGIDSARLVRRRA